LYSSRTQANNTAGGDIVAGDKHEHHAHLTSPLTPIGALNARYLREQQSSPEIEQIIDALSHYMGKSTNPDVRALAEKLTDSERGDLTQYAESLKERITKKILRFQTSVSAQQLFAHLLADLIRRFRLVVTPAIQEGQPRSHVDRLISTEVIDPIVKGLEENVLGFTSEEILGMLFFLAGNCHLRWDKC
jgi:hypothetical protein